MSSKAVWDKVLTKGFLGKEYAQNKKSPYTIAKQVGCSTRTVYDYIKIHKIPRLDMLRKNCINKKYGLLTVVKKVGLHKGGSYLWECVCDCGNTTVLPTSSLDKTKDQSLFIELCTTISEHNK